MNQLFKYEEINGVKVVFFVNKSGSMWFAIKDGKAYGAHSEHTEEDLEDNYRLMKQMVTEKL